MTEKRYADDLVTQLKKRRYQLGLPQAALDDRIGCATGLVAKWETGNRKPTAFNLFIISVSFKLILAG